MDLTLPMRCLRLILTSLSLSQRCFRDLQHPETPVTLLQLLKLGFFLGQDRLKTQSLAGAGPLHHNRAKVFVPRGSGIAPPTFGKFLERGGSRACGKQQAQALGAQHQHAQTKLLLPKCTNHAGAPRTSNATSSKPAAPSALSLSFWR